MGLEVRPRAHVYLIRTNITRYKFEYVIEIMSAIEIVGLVWSGLSKTTKPIRKPFVSMKSKDVQ